MVYTDGIMALSEPEYGDDADIAVINSNSVKIDDHMTNAFNNLAEPFNPNKAYEVGEIVVYEKVTYIFIVAKSAGAWDATKVEVKPLGTAIFEKEGGAGSLSDLTDTDIDTPAEGEVLTWDGEKWVNAEGTPSVTKTATGTPIEITDGADAPLVKCTTAITGSQDLHGYDKPWVGGAGKQMLNPADYSGATTYISNVGDEFTIIGSGLRVIYQFDFLANVTYTLNITKISGPDGVKPCIICRTLDDQNQTTNYPDPNNKLTFTLTENSTRKIIIQTATGIGTAPTGTVFKIMMEIGNTAHTWEPYSNICPITAYNQSTISVEDENEVVQQTSTATYSQSIYQGNADFVGGSAECDMPCIDLGSFNYSVGTDGYFYSTDVLSDSKAYGAYEVCNAICSIAEKSSQAVVSGKSVDCAVAISVEKQLMFYISAYAGKTGAEIKTLLTGQTLAYELATPTTETITPTNLPIKSLFGYNHIESSTGEMEIEYITKGYQPLVDLIQSEDASLNVFNLWTNTSGASTGTFALSAPIDDFDFISFYYGVYGEYTGSPNIADFRMISVKELKALHEYGKNLILTGYGQRVVYIDIYDSSVTVSMTNDSQVLLAVKGIKIDGGGSSSGTDQHTYSTQEQIVGTWIDGSDVYEKTIVYSTPQSVTGSFTSCGVDSTDISLMLDVFGIHEDGTGYGDIMADPTLSSHTLLGLKASDTHNIKTLIIRYTKSTATTRSLSKGSTDSLKADLSDVKGEGEEILKGDEKALKIDESEDTETKETDETEGNADEVQDETVTE